MIIKPKININIIKIPYVRGLFLGFMISWSIFMLYLDILLGLALLFFCIISFYKQIYEFLKESQQ